MPSIEPSLGGCPSWPHDTYGAGPVGLTPVGFFYDASGRGGGGGGGSDPKYKHFRENGNFHYSDDGREDAVHVGSGVVYCGTKGVPVTGSLAVSSGSVYANITVKGGTFTGRLASSPGGDLSILLYQVTDDTIYDYVATSVFIPYYN